MCSVHFHHHKQNIGLLKTWHSAVIIHLFQKETTTKKNAVLIQNNSEQSDIWSVSSQSSNHWQRHQTNVSGVNWQKKTGRIWQTISLSCKIVHFNGLILQKDMLFRHCIKSGDRADHFASLTLLHREVWLRSVEQKEHHENSWAREKWMRMFLSVRQLTCLGACVSCGCCTPKQEGWSPHPQEPAMDTQARTSSFLFKGQ